jgi:5-methylcytosine-specific restriction endonuclease McrA
VVYFYSAAKHRSRGVLWSIFAPALIPHHPRGYREIRSNAEMRKLLDRKIVAQNGECTICKVKFTEYTDVVPDYINPRGMGGAWRDDHLENIQAVHWWCNGEKGSSRG